MIVGRTTPIPRGGQIYGTYLSQRWYLRFDYVTPLEVSRRVSRLKEPLSPEYDLRARLVYVTLRYVLMTWLYDKLGDDTQRPFYLTEPEWNFAREWKRLDAADRQAIWEYALLLNPHLEAWLVPCS